jgi:acetyl esterase/lipase
MRRVILLGVVTLVATLAVWHPARVAVQALLLLPALFPSAPFEPLSLLTTAPSRGQAEYAYAAGTVDVDVLAPRGGGRHGAMVLLLGAGDLPRSDVAVHFAEALARLGIVTMLPQSSGMLAERLTAEEIDAIRVSIGALDARADVDPGRVGILGLSASGGLAIVAAAQPDLRQRIRFVNSFGSYDDATSLLIDVASHSEVVDAVAREWIPDTRTVEVVDNALNDAGVGTADRAELLGGTTRTRAEEITRGFSSSVRDRLARMSPSAVLGDLSAHLYLMHDVDDSFIPFTESRALAAAAPPGTVVRYTEFAIFAHVIPERPVPWQTFVPDVWRLFWHVHAVLLEML